MCWRLGIVPHGGDAATMTVADTQIMAQLIMTYESLDDFAKFDRLAQLLGAKDGK